MAQCIVSGLLQWRYHMTPYSPPTRMAAWALAIALFGPVARAQSTLQGSIRDSHGHPVPGATVYLQVKTSGKTLTTHTDSKGSYRWATLRGGAYSLRVETS